MLANKTRTDLIEEIGNVTPIVVMDRKSVNEIKQHLSKNGISGGEIEKTLNNHTVLNGDDIDTRVVALITEQLFRKTGIQSINPHNWFTEKEMNIARQYYPLEEVKQPVFPYTFERVNMVGDNVFSAAIDAKTIAEWLDVGDLEYDPDIQRQATKKIRNGEVYETPTIIQKNVNEIEKLMLGEELKVTTLAFNASPMTSINGDELTYDSKRGTLTINEGTVLNILDGFHRCLGSRAALSKNPDLDFKFNILISNYTTREAQQYQAQLAKATPIHKARIEALEGSRLSFAVMKQLQADSELRGRVSSSHTVNVAKNELVSSRVLSDAIDREFKMSARVETYEVAEYLKEFFNHLIGLNQDEFLYNKNSKLSLMSTSRMFAGYVALAAKMKRENVAPQKVNKVLDQVDFSRNNLLWQEIGLLDDKLNISARANDGKIAIYFRGLDIN